MAPDPPPAHPSLREELPAHASWVRDLARSLVRDEATAEDLAQETALAALQHEGSVRGDLGPWLAQVTRNFARRGWRSAVRRSARERASARPESVPGADESAARLETQARLVEELAALEPALRRALVRRYFDGWTAARIARESGEPASTVRWRLQRGLAELRSRLDQKNGGDGIQWRLALLPLCASPSPWGGLSEALRPRAGAGAISGVLTMKAISQVLAVTVLAASVGVGVWWSADREESNGAPRPASSELSAAESSRSIEEPTDVSATETAGRESVPALPVLLPPRPSLEPELDATPRVSGRCLDEALLPLGDVRISLEGQESVARSRSDGVFAIPANARRQLATLRFEGKGLATHFAQVRIPEGGDSSLGDVLLSPGGRVRGRVLGPSGVPYAGAAVTVTSPELWGSLDQARVRGPLASPALEATSGQDGHFEIDGVGFEPVRVWAGAEGMRFAVSSPVEVPERGLSEELVLFLEPTRRDDRITGIVLSPAGEPFSHASLTGMERSGNGSTSLGVEVDGEGRFELAAKPSHVYDLWAADPEGRWAEVGETGIEPGTQDLEFVFQESRWIEVRVTSAGQPVEDFALTALEPGLDTIDFGTDEPRPEGRGRLRVQRRPFLASVDARGFALARQGPFTPESAPQTLAFELDREPGIRGRVMAGERPVVGAMVTLHSAPPNGRIDHQGYPALQTPHSSDETTTDEGGRFLLRLRQKQTYVIRAVAAGYAPGSTPPMELSPHFGRDDLELVLGPGGALEGRVLVAPGRDPAGVIVAVNRGDALARTVRSDVEGRFRFEGLTAGPWHLSRGAVEVDPRGGGTAFSSADTPTVIPYNCTIRDDEVTLQDLDLRDFEPCEFAGLLLVNGAPAKDWTVMAWPGARQAVVGTLPSTAVDAEGRFALTIDESGPLRLTFTPPAELGGEGTVEVRTEIHPGENEWSEDFAMGRLSGLCLSPVAVDGESLFYTTAKGTVPSSWLPIQPDAEGRYVLPFVSAGKGSIQRISEKNGSLSWSTLIETEIPAGGERMLDIP